MDDLVTWYRAQLDEDERVARAAADEDTPPWRLDYDERRYAGRIRSADGYTVVHQEDSTPGPVTAEHIARWDPARVLAEVDAKRRILDEHPAGDDGFCGDGIGLVGCKWAYPCPTVRLLALPLADRPGYQESWRP